MHLVFGEEEGGVTLVLRDDLGHDDLTQPAGAARDTSALAVLEDGLVFALIEGERESVRAAEGGAWGESPLLGHGAQEAYSGMMTWSDWGRSSISMVVPSSSGSPSICTGPGVGRSIRSEWMRSVV